MYSPFLDNKGRPLTIEKVKYCHLSQLAECDEGHHIEYKLLLEDGGKAQLAKEIASFANCEGGWLIVGIDDKTRDIRPISKQDYSQRIGKIATRISPMPEFSTRFLNMPNDNKSGVLLVYVYEGKNAPYICNGSIYVRSGSSKEPVKPADRGNIEYLYERSKGYKKEIDDFCRRDFFYPYNNILQRRVTYPIANIYLKNICPKKDSFFSVYANRDKLIGFIKSKYDIFEHISYSMNSIIFMQKSILPGSSVGTFVFELFYDWSCKITIPIGLSNGSKKDDYLSIYTELGYDEEKVKDLQLADGTDVFNALFFGMILFENVAKKYKLKEKDYVFCLELENAGNTVVAFDGEKFKEYIQKYGIPYAHKEINKSKITFLRDHPKLKFRDLSYSIISDELGAIFGFRSDCIFRILQDSNKKYSQGK